MRYSVKIGRSLKLSERVINAIKTASLLHDIGKVGIDLSVINKHSRLSEWNWQKMRMHPEIGAKIVSQVGFLNDIVPMVKHHHERFGGGGYPEPDKAGNRIPLGARIIAIADAFDAMTSNRPYRMAMPKEYALKELKKYAGSQFDPKIVNAVISKIKL